jgi:hypothetical protein
MNKIKIKLFEEDEVEAMLTREENPDLFNSEYLDEESY